MKTMTEPANATSARVLFDAELADEQIFGPVTPLFADHGVTEVLVNDFDRIYFEKEGVFSRCANGFSSPHCLQRFVRRLLQLMDKCADRRSPLVDGVLPDGTRVHVALPPVTKTVTISLRRHSPSPLDWHGLVRAECIPEKWAARLMARLEASENMLICGTTGAGKTTLIRAMLTALPANERIITLEDTPELNLAGPNCVSLIARQVPDDLAPPISLTNLVRHALRMRPQRLVLGEIRGEEALVFLDALSTGHRGSISSIHGGDCREALNRLESLASRGAPQWSPETIRNLIFHAVKMIICVKLVTGKGGEKKRAIIEIADVTALESFGFLLSPWV